MSQGDAIRFKHTIIDVNFTRPPPVDATSDGAEVLPSVPVGKQLADTTIRLPRPPVEQAPQRVEPTPVQVIQQTPGGTHVMVRPFSSTLPVRQGPLSPSVVLEQVEMPAKVDRRLVVLHGDATEQARAYRLLRHRLLGRGDPRVIAVTSALPAEGKTSCAANLALLLADETMSRVLLVDANLRRPALGRLFGYAPGDSFVRRLVVERDATAPYPVARVIGTRLDLAALPGNHPGGTRLDRLLLSTAVHELRGAYDYIVIDSAAVLESADADIAGECADGVLLVARAGVTRKAQLTQALEQIHPTPVLGAVLLDV